MKREALYNLVWAVPVSKLARQFGLSGRGLAKLCQREEIPVPPRGYWAKLAAGHPVRQTPLPDPVPGQSEWISAAPTGSDFGAEGRAWLAKRTAARKQAGAPPFDDASCADPEPPIHNHDVHVVAWRARSAIGNVRVRKRELQATLHPTIARLLREDREALERRTRVLGAESPATLITLSNLGVLLRLQNKLDEAEPYHVEALEKRRRVLGEDHPSTLISVSNMGDLRKAQGRLDEAEPYVTEALDKRRRILGPDHPQTLGSAAQMGELRTLQQRWAEAEAVLRPAADLAEAKLPPRSEARVALVKALEGLYRAWDKAEPGKGHDAQAATWTARRESAERKH